MERNVRLPLLRIRKGFSPGKDRTLQRGKRKDPVRFRERVS